MKRTPPAPAAPSPAASLAPVTRRTRTRTKDASLVTLDMVAQRAGVSPSTVSRILNGTAVVSGDKKDAVDRAIAELGFVPNPVARGLAGGRTLSIGVVALSIDSPYYGVTMRGIEDALDPVGYSALFVSGHWNEDEELRAIELLRGRRVDGLIMLTGRLSDAALRACAKHLPVVVTGRRMKAAGLCSLTFDDRDGARLATQHLLDLGHRRIAFIGGDLAHPDAVEREAGYRETLQAAGLTVDPSLMACGDYHEAGGMLAVERLMLSRKRFTAIFAANDQMAFGAALALHRRGLRVPEDVSLVGYDDLLVAKYSIPPLTSVHQPGYAMGQLAANAMLQLLRGVKPDGRLPAPTLSVRESTRPLVKG